MDEAFPIAGLPLGSYLRSPATMSDLVTMLERNLPRAATGGPIGLGAAFAWLRLCLARRRERIDLGDLSDHELRDLGLTRNQAVHEAMRRAWRGADRR